MQVGAKNKLSLIILIIFCFVQLKLKASDDLLVEYECLLDTGASGLFQYQRKFLKETEFFPYKTLMIFSNDFKFLKEIDNTFNRQSEAKYQFECKKNNKETTLKCISKGKMNVYQIKFSTKTLRYRKTLITDYWIEGKGSEVDYVHIAHGYCYNVIN